MKKTDFAALLFRIEELLMEVDYWRRQISECKLCRGFQEEDYKNMCPSCLKALHKEFEALKNVSSNAEMRECIMTLRQALENDATGELMQIFRLTRKVTMN